MSAVVPVYLLFGVAVTAWGWHREGVSVADKRDALAAVVALLGMVIAWPLTAYLLATSPAIAIEADRPGREAGPVRKHESAVPQAIAKDEGHD